MHKRKLTASGRSLVGIEILLELIKPLGLTLGFTLSTLVGVAALAEAVASTGLDTFDASSLSISVSEQLELIEPQLLAQQQQPRTALVIGNADYGADDYLEGPDNDARAMYEKLRDLGFDVPPPLINANKQEMEAALRDFASRMSPGGVNVFYYSGHGVQIDGYNYLLPIGLNEASSEVYVRYNAVPLEYVVAEMFSIVHDFNFLIIDACRDNPFYNRWGRPKGPGNEGLASTRPPRGTVIAYATQENDVAVDSLGEDNSPFTASLLRYLDVPDLNIFEMLIRVVADVASQTNDDQIPSWEGNPKESVVLNPSTLKVSSSDSSEPQPTTQSDLEQETEIPPPAIPIELPALTVEATLISTATGVDYQPLRDALAAGDFRLADNTTNRLISRALDDMDSQERWLNDFSCEDLKIIDQLWLAYSDSQFGFSVQQEIYQSLGETNNYDEVTWNNFGDRVGWRSSDPDFWLNYDSLIFNRTAASGHLPAILYLDFGSFYSNQAAIANESMNAAAAGSATSQAFPRFIQRFAGCST